MKLRHAVIACALLLSAPAAQTQQWLVNNAINNQVVETAVCDDALKKHERLPDVCAKYPKYSGAVSAQGRAVAQASGNAKPAGGTGAATALKFTPYAGDTTVQDFANDLGKNAGERQQLAAAINAVKSDVLEREYGAKGWKNNVAGAYAFFVGSLHMAWSGNEPSTAQKDALFAAMGAKLAPSLAGVSDREKTALYNTLIASATLPLLLHLDGKQRNNKAESEQARELAAQYSRRIMKMEPQELAGLLQSAADGGPSAAATADAPATPGTVGGAADGEYTCAQLQMLTLPDASGSLQIRWTPGALPPFRISGGRYSAARGGGSVNLANGVIAFSGGAYDGWRGTVGADTRPFIVFNGTDHGMEKSKPGRGDFKCRVNNS